MRPQPDAAFKVVKVKAVRRHPPARTPNAKPGAAYCTWTPEEDALLGRFTDAEVARKLGYAATRVRRRRRLLRLPSNNPDHRHWTKKEIALLGTRPDREVAPLVNRSLSNVRYKRLQLGIPFHNPDYEIWKPDELALLGKLPDEEVARRTGHSPRRPTALSRRASTGTRRTSRCAPARPCPPAPRWRQPAIFYEPSDDRTMPGARQNPSAGSDPGKPAPWRGSEFICVHLWLCSSHET
jgi:hypothetical protein